MTRLTAPATLAALTLFATSAVASSMVDFARCLSRAGATYYTADWCPHCARQNRMFGNALRYVRVVDCTDGCVGIKSLPTWSFKDGSQTSGVASFEMLASRTGCRLEGERDEPGNPGSTAPSSGSGGRERYIGGAKIIEVR